MHMVKKHNGDRLSKTVLSLCLSLSLSASFTHKHAYTHVHTKSKSKKHLCPKRIWQELRQVEMNTETLRAHSKKSAVRKTPITGSPPPREEMSARNTLAASSSTGVIRAVCRRSRKTKYHCHLYRSSSTEINPNKCNERFTKYLAD